MTHKTAKLFVNGGSQAVRLPPEFRFEESDEEPDLAGSEGPNQLPRDGCQ
jgi:hypothetical protein